MISIIVPVYNIEQYLDRCIASILNQTYRDIEVILVDDGSNDKSGRICDCYGEKDERVHVIHQENKGLVQARKNGALYARGEYIFLVDGDDWIERDALERMRDALYFYKCDIVQSASIREYTYGFEYNDSPVYGLFYLRENDNEFLRNLFVDEKTECVRGVRSNIWGCLLPRELYIECQMNVPDEITRGEDDACYFPMILKAESIYEMQDYLYHYNQRDESMTHKKIDFVNYECVYLYNLIHPIIVSHPARDVLMQSFFKYLIMRTNDHFKHSLGMYYDDNMFFFPFFDICYKKKIVLYGAGRVGNDYLKSIKTNNFDIQIVGIVDQFRDGIMEDYSIKNNIKDINGEYDYVVISIASKNEVEKIVNLLAEDGVLKEKILWCKPRRIGIPLAYTGN